MQDRPTGPELLDAVAQFLNEEVEPLVAHDPRMRFRVLIAINVLKIVNRELALAEPLLQDEWQRLARLTGQSRVVPPTHPDQLRQEVEDMNRELCARLRAGEAGDDERWQSALFEHLQATTLEKLQIANPRLVNQAGN
jgi:hypothetical protein